MIPEVMDRCMDIYIKALCGKIISSTDAIARVYEYAPRGSKFRLFARQVFVFVLMAPVEEVAQLNGDVQKLLADVPDLAQEIVPLLRGYTRPKHYSELLRSLGGCVLHAHAEASECPWARVEASEIALST